MNDHDRHRIDDALRGALRRLGGNAATARAIGVTPATLNGALSRAHALSAVRILRLCRLFESRPDVAPYPTARELLEVLSGAFDEPDEAAGADEAAA